MNLETTAARRFTAWSAILGGVFAFMNVALVLLATAGDTNVIYHAPTMLAWPTETRDMFRWAMLADIPGFYLAVLAVATFFWRAFRDTAGALGDMALLAIVVYVVLGVSGAAIMQASLHPLARLHAGGDDTVRAATEAAWTAIVYACEQGLWWCEGPLVFFWGLIVAKQLQQAGAGRWFLLPLKIVGWCYALFFIFGFFPEAGELTELVVTIAVLIFPAWMIWLGTRLLRQPRLDNKTAAVVIF